MLNYTDDGTFTALAGEPGVVGCLFLQDGLGPLLAFGSVPLGANQVAATVNLMFATRKRFRSVGVHDVKHRRLRQAHLRGDRAERVACRVKRPNLLRVHDDPASAELKHQE
jgi:hypothetical protein